MAKRAKKIDLSEHVLDINRRRYSVNKLDLVELDDYISSLAGSREYEYHAIRDILIYLWGGSYETVQDLGEENWENKEVIRQRFHGNKDRFLQGLPLPRKLSGVCHMATGTGKSYVIFAVAYLSILLGKVDRVLVLTPSSTIIKQGLREKFRTYMFGEEGTKIQENLPSEYRNRTVKLIKRNDPPEDNAIMVENINGIYQYFRDKEHNSIAGFFDGADEVLVLSDEVHHAYSRLNFTSRGADYDFSEINRGGRQTDAENERRWMKFIREAEHAKIQRHIGFTGTPYNKNDFFTDVIFNYSIKRGIDEKYIKDIDPILKYDESIDKSQRYEQIIQTHYQNKDKYSYEEKGRAQVKPTTVFICKSQKSAQKHANEFALALADYLKKNFNYYKDQPRSILEKEAHEKVICVVSETKDDVEVEFQNVERTDPNKPGGKVEYIFSVQMLTEGWDVDNVFQMVPMEEKAFNSKLLISQVLGRGLRIPRDVRKSQIDQTYPMLTVTNHESFSSHIRELLNQVTQSELRFTSSVFQKSDFERYQHHLTLFNVRYLPSNKLVEKKGNGSQQKLPGRLNLERQEEKLRVSVEYLHGKREYALTKSFYTVDEVVSEINQRFRSHSFERKHFDFGDGNTLDSIPKWDDIEQVIQDAMDRAGIEGNQLSKENRNKINLFFNSYLPQGKKKVVRQNIEGDLFGISTTNMPNSTVSAGGLDNYISLFVSEEYRGELKNEDTATIEDLADAAEKAKERRGGGQGDLFEKNYDFNDAYIRQLVPGKNVFAVNQSMFKTPQDMVIVSHKPERQFVFRLIDNSKLVHSWIKSPDKGFYSLDYTFWKGGKDRVVRSFNPDFLIKLELNEYIRKVGGTTSNKLRDLQNSGVEQVVLVVEIKGDVEMKERVAKAKSKAGKEHFQQLSERLLETNPINVEEKFRNSLRQHYEFFLLHPEDYDMWFRRLRRGEMWL